MTEKLMVNIVWHMHQPFYWNEEKGFFDFPWVRTHATKDYLFMGKLVEKFPSLRVTFNFSPSLLRQFQLYLEGREDEIMKLAKKRASSLTEEDKRLIKENFLWLFLLAPLRSGLVLELKKTCSILPLRFLTCKFLPAYLV